MVKNAVALLAVLLAVPVAAAQDELKKEFAPAYVANVLLKQAMKIKETLKPEEHPQKKMSFYGTPDGEYDLEHHYGEKKFVFSYVYGENLVKDEPSKVNTWNSLGWQSRAYLNTNGQLVLAGVLPYEA